VRLAALGVEPPFANRGWLADQHFFVFVLLASVPPVIIAWFAPFHIDASSDGKAPLRH
jgi:hypothetical protein